MSYFNFYIQSLHNFSQNRIFRLDLAIKLTAPTSAVENLMVCFAFKLIRTVRSDMIIDFNLFDSVSVDSITEGDRRALMADLPASSTYSGALSYHHPNTGLIRRSLPNMAHSMLVHEPAKIYPYHLLLITNYRLPSDVDRCNLEVSESKIVYDWLNLIIHLSF